jgi:hypothetical protein
MTLFAAASALIVDSIAIADIEALLGAVPPDGILNEPRKRPWEAAIELPRVDSVRDGFYDLRAAARLITPRPIRVVGVEPVQNAGPVQKVMDQRIDRNHAAADFQPAAPLAGRAEKKLRQCQQEHFVGHAIDLFQRVDQSRSHSGQPVWPGRRGGAFQLPVEPGDEIATRDIANKEEQRVGGLVQPAVAQPMIWQRALRQVIRRAARVPGFVVSAVLEMPIARKLRAAWSTAQIVLDRMPGRLAMAFHVVRCHLVGDALIAQSRDKPIEQNWHAPRADCCGDAFGFEPSAGIIDNRGAAGELANAVDQSGCMIDGGTICGPKKAARVRILGCALGHYGQIIDTSLRCASLSPSM